MKTKVVLSMAMLLGALVVVVGCAGDPNMQQQRVVPVSYQPPPQPQVVYVERPQVQQQCCGETVVIVKPKQQCCGEPVVVVEQPAPRVSHRVVVQEYEGVPHNNAIFDEHSRRHGNNFGNGPRGGDDSVNGIPGSNNSRNFHTGPKKGVWYNNRVVQ